LSGIKSINYLSSITLREKLTADNAFDVLFHFKGKVLEVSRSNFFIVKNEILVTPDKDILMGITRESVISLAEPHFTVEERDLHVEELWEADEAFMTGTTKKVLPVVQVGEHRIGSGLPGPVTRKLMTMFLEFENEQAGY
jgi:branched-subunit amino acid aminotransferase/4-amino-4-deoxychorismate lyase